VIYIDKVPPWVYMLEGGGQKPARVNGNRNYEKWEEKENVK
jgi:hypothetical protein